MDALEDSVKEDVQELYSHISDISSWLPRFLRCLKRYESLPSPTEFPRVVTSIGREFKVVLADMKSKVPAMKRVETLKCRVWPYLKAAGEGEGSDGAENLAVNLQLLQLEWQKTCALVSGPTLPITFCPRTVRSLLVLFHYCTPPCLPQLSK